MAPRSTATTPRASSPQGRRSAAASSPANATAETATTMAMAVSGCACWSQTCAFASVIEIALDRILVSTIACCTEYWCRLQNAGANDRYERRTRIVESTLGVRLAPRSVTEESSDRGLFFYRKLFGVRNHGVEQNTVQAAFHSESTVSEYFSRISPILQ